MSSTVAMAQLDLYPSDAALSHIAAFAQLYNIQAGKHAAVYMQLLHMACRCQAFQPPATCSECCMAC